MDNISDKGISYQSPEKKKREAFRLLTIEVLVLALAILIIVGMLQYFKVVNLSPIARIVDFFPKNIPVVSVKSDNPSYRLKMTNKDAVVKFLKELGYYDDRFSAQTTEEFVPKGAIITLTDEEQKGAPIRNANTQKPSFSGSITPVNDGDQIEIKIYISPEVFQENIDLNKAFHDYFIFLTYKFFNQQSSLEELRVNLRPYSDQTWFQLEKL